MMKAIIVIILLLLIGTYFISTSYDLNLKKTEDRKFLVTNLVGWVVKITKNLFKLSGEAVKLDWNPVKNDTKTTN